jgi:hypothetical protein
MVSPFRNKKKERKRERRFAKNVALTADKFEAEGTKPDAVALLRRLVDMSLKTSLMKRKKES